MALSLCDNSREILGLSIHAPQVQDQESILPSFHFSGFPIFAGKLECLLHMEKTHQLKNDLAYQQKTEKFFVYKEKKFGRIDSRT